MLIDKIVKNNLIMKKITKWTTYLCNKAKLLSLYSAHYSS